MGPNLDKPLLTGDSLINLVNPDGEEAPSVPSTLPADVPFTFDGLTNPAVIEDLDNGLRSYLSDIGTVLDLSLLDALRVTNEYGATLASLDLGYGGPPPVPSSGDAVGMAMTVKVLRSGRVKATVIFDWDLFAGLYADDPAANTLAQYVIAHEMGHVADLAERQACVPMILPPPIGERTRLGYLTFIADACWGEYVASRYAATIDPRQIKNFVECLSTHLLGMNTRLPLALDRFRSDENIVPLFTAVITDFNMLWRLIGYLVGHLHGLGQDFQTLIDTAQVQRIQRLVGRFLDSSINPLQTLWETRGQWENGSVFEPLVAQIDATLYESGFSLLTTPRRPLYMKLAPASAYSVIGE